MSPAVLAAALLPTMAALAIGWALLLRKQRIVTAAARLVHERDRQLAETKAALKLSEERLSEFSRSTVDWLWEIDSQYRFTADTGREAAGGVVGDELIGLARWEMPGTDQDDPIWNEYRAKLDARQPLHDFEYSYLGNDGVRRHACISGHPNFGDDGAFLGYRGAARDITAQVEARARIDRANLLLDAVRQVQGSYIAGAEAESTCDQMLSVLLQLTGSEYGFVAETPTDGNGQQFVRIRALTNIAWNDATRKLYNERTTTRLEFHNLDTLFGAVITTGRPVIANDPANDPRSGGLPPGHPQMHAFLGLPLFAGKAMIGMMGLANRPGGYDDEVVEFLGPLTGACSSVLAAIQADAEQARVATELRRSDERLQSTLESTGVGPWDWDVQAGTFQFDQKFTRKLGYEADEIASTIEAWESLVHPDDLARIRQMLGTEAVREMETLELVYRVRKKQGGWRWLMSRGRVVQRDSEGKSVRFIGTHLDITGVKETEMALRRSEERFCALAESSRAVPWEADVGTLRITYVGPQIERVTGYSPADWVDKDLWPQCLHPDDRARVIKECDERATAGIESNLEYRLISLDGRIVWVRDLVSVISGDGGQKWLYGVMVDITDEKAREQALRESESRYRQAERVAGIVHWSISLDPANADERGRLAFSDTAAKFFGVAPTELNITIDGYVEKFVHPDDRARVRAAHIGITTDAERDLSLEYRVIRKDGSTAVVSELGQRIHDDTGRLTSAFGTIQDITERKQGENALRRAQMEAEMANRAKSQFLANVSHELRTPLNAIIGFSEVMKDELLGPLGAPVYKEYSGDIHDSGRHLLAIINDILDLSRVESGQATLSESEIAIDQLIANCLVLVRGKAGEGGLTLTADVSASLPMVVGDERLLKQALLNLLSNAVKFTPRDGSVRVKAALSGGGLDIMVIDSGIGMTATEIEQVAKPFVQLENWLVRKYEGTGLGLSIVKAFCELHGGALRITSEVGRGTTTTIHLPPFRVLPAEKTRALAE